MNKNTYKKIITDHVVNLCTIPSPTGYTAKAEDYVFQALTQMGYSPEYTNKRAVRVHLGGEGNPLVFSAHVDTLGTMVRSVKGNGRLRITRLGGYHEGYLEGVTCKIHTRAGKVYTGTFQAVNPSIHVNNKLRTEERTDSNLEVVIDEVVSKKEETLELGIGAGDFISIDPYTQVTESGFIKSRHLDDKASAAVLLGLAQRMKEDGVTPSRSVTLLFTNYEEVGHGASAGIPADTQELIAVDMGVIGDDLQADETKVSICAKDSSGPYNRDLVHKLADLADRLELPYVIDIFPFYASDTSSALGAGHDLLHGLIGPGVSASHGYERCHQDALENTMLLLLAYIQE